MNERTPEIRNPLGFRVQDLGLGFRVWGLHTRDQDIRVNGRTPEIRNLPSVKRPLANLMQTGYGLEVPAATVLVRNCQALVRLVGKNMRHRKGDILQGRMFRFRGEGRGDGGLGVSRFRFQVISTLRAHNLLQFRGPDREASLTTLPHQGKDRFAVVALEKIEAHNL